MQDKLRTVLHKAPILAKVLTYIMQGWPEKSPGDELFPYWTRRLELGVQDGRLLWGNRIIVPVQGRAVVLQELHESHPGVVHMKLLAWSYVWWPSINRDIEHKVQQCHQCQVNQQELSSS